MNLELNKIREVLKSFQYIEFAYLYGSYSKGTNTKFSDVDIAVYQTNNSDYELKKNEFSIESKLMIEMPGLEFDVRSMNTAPIIVTGKILNEGELLFCRNESFYLDYLVSKRIQYLDFLIIYNPMFEKRYREMLNG